MAKSVFGLWAEIKVSQLNRLLRPFNVRLVVKGSKEWGDQVAITAHRIDGPFILREVPSGVDGVKALEMSDGTIITSRDSINWTTGSLGAPAESDDDLHR
jgi:hypothetical protein